jgi:hypothetical protein
MTESLSAYRAAAGPDARRPLGQREFQSCVPPGRHRWEQAVRLRGCRWRNMAAIGGNT